MNKINVFILTLLTSSLAFADAPTTYTECRNPVVHPADQNAETMFSKDCQTLYVFPQQGNFDFTNEKTIEENANPALCQQASIIHKKISSITSLLAKKAKELADYLENNPVQDWAAFTDKTIEQQKALRKEFDQAHSELENIENLLGLTFSANISESWTEATSLYQTANPSLKVKQLPLVGAALSLIPNPKEIDFNNPVFTPSYNSVDAVNDITTGQYDILGDTDKILNDLSQTQLMTKVSKRLSCYGAEFNRYPLVNLTFFYFTLDQEGKSTLRAWTGPIIK